MRVLKWIGIVLGVLVLVALIAAGTIYIMGGRVLARSYNDVTVRQVTIPTDAAAIARGDHLVYHVNLCTDCHGDNLEGAVLVNDPSFAVIAAPNLTSGQGGVAANGYSDAQWVRAITQGVGGDGRGMLVMPAWHYHALNDADLGALVAYLKQAPPQDNVLTKRKLGPIGRALLAFGAAQLQPDIVKSLPAAQTIAPAANAEYGAYMVEIAGCRGCHGMNLAGGDDPNAPKGPNITATQLGTWSEDQFVNFIHTGALPTGGSVSEEMPWTKYAGMEDVEVKAIYAYLHTTEPLPDNP